MPDYALISEIILYSFGYMEARAMGKKLVQTYTLCSEQLSKQDHYDYGMRAVMAVLRAAGNLKQVGTPPDPFLLCGVVDACRVTTTSEGDVRASVPNTDLGANESVLAKQKAENRELAEDVLMLRAITDVNLPKFLDEDVPLFQGILSDLFPGVEVPPADYVNLTEALRANALKTNLQPLPSFFEKAIQLYEMIVVRHGLMLVGQSFSMKTVAIRTLQQALGHLHRDGLNNEFATKTYTLNPKAITMGQLYGMDDPISQEWTDGVLAKLFRDATRDTSPDRKWLVFDGPVDAIWIESMNTVRLSTHPPPP